MYERKRLAAAAGAAVLMLSAGTLPGRAAEKTNAEKKVRLMCLGDSITDGFWLPGGYRNTLCSLLTENGQDTQVDFVGSNWGGSGYDPQHAGYSGYSVDNIAQEDSISGQRTGLSSFAEWMLGEYPADVVFLQIGTNDILSLYDLEHFGERLEGLVDTVLASLPPEGCLYLATLPQMDATNNLYISDYFFTVESMDAAVESCNEQIRTLAKKKQAEGKPLILAEMNRVLAKDDLYDGVHPNEGGYQKMGEFWYARLNEYLTGAVQPETTAPPVRPELLCGDVDGNGTVAAADAVLLAKYLCTEGELDAEEAARSDMNTDGRLNAVDLTLLKRAL